jgi:ribosomal-protein-alanine N-acetyltransferase
MALEIRLLRDTWEDSLIEFFAVIAGLDDTYFHPHPFTEEYARELSSYKGQDLHYVIVLGRKIVAYGILRGWDKGFEIPSLGIFVHPEMRGHQLGELLLRFLHSAARERGARHIRLKVYPDNVAALSLYRKLGYRFEQDQDAGQMVGMLNL